MDEHSLEAGVEIGDFRIERRLGAGGMGIVYQARQISLDRTVALKILGGALNRQGDRLRFQREAQAVAKLKHPGIALVYFIGQDRHLCFIAMEYIDGPPLRAIIDRIAASRDATLTFDGALGQPDRDLGEPRAVRFDTPTAAYAAPSDGVTQAEGPAEGDLTPQARRLFASRSYLERCCEVAKEAALALAHAHERGVVHRDVKPENVLVDREGHVHLIDFGVARFFEDVSLTNTGALVGTPMYMSPEQATGRIDLDHRTDIYSLGLVLYELMTLARPIALSSREGVLRQIVTKAMPPASWRNPALPRDLEGVLHKAIAKDPDDRYQTSALFAEDLSRWLEGKPVAALPYRYRLDLREIKAERPAGIMVLAFIHFLASAFALVVAAFATLALIVNSYQNIGATIQDPSSPFAPQVRAFFAVVVAGAVVVSAFALWVGIGLLSANRRARLASITVSGIIAAWCLFTMFAVLFHGRAVWWGLALQGLTVAALGALSYLMRRSTRDWFRLAARVRSEWGSLPAGAGGRDKRS